MMKNNKFSAYDAAVGFYNLFFEGGQKLSLFEYLQNSFCDEIMEIDLNAGIFNLIYTVNNKYQTPFMNGPYKSMIAFSSENIIHPDEKEAFLAMMDPKNILHALHTSQYPNFCFGHFRSKVLDGTYRWIELAIITGEENGIPNGIVMAYLFDINNAKKREFGEVIGEGDLLRRENENVTGLLSSLSFYEKAKEVSKKEKKNWCAICIDIEHFKLFDEWYGRETGDYLLTQIGSILNSYTNKHGGVPGYFGQDDFALLVPFNIESITAVYDEIKDAIASHGYSAGFIPAFGVCELKIAKDIVDAFDKASVAEFRAKQDVKNRITIYDEKVSQQQEKEYHIFLDFMNALKNGEISFYLQPQVRISTKKVVGAEALARWITKDGTFISPTIFVPILEKFSFITDLDKYIWESVCEWLRSLIDRGIKPVPISINVSQIDIFTLNVPEYLKQLVDKYNLDPSLLKVEITESSYAENIDKVDELVTTLRDMGFFVLMDDFGSGYSSLNMLRNLKVDAIKLDALFLNISEADYQKGINILESVVNMAKTISLPIIVEGIETKKQEEFLVDLGCRYAQGFYYSRPIPASDFENIIKDENNVDLNGIIGKNNGELKIREFLDENIYSDAMLNSVLGPVAFYAWDEKERIDIVRYNQRFYETVDVEDFNTRLEHIEKYVPKTDLPKFYGLLKEAMSDRANGSHGVVRFHRLDNRMATFFMRFYYIGDKEGLHRFYGSSSNISELMDLQDKMRLISEYSSDTIIFLKRKDGKTTFEIASHGLRDKIDMPFEMFAHELDIRVLHKRIPPKECDEFRIFTANAYANNSSFSYTVPFIKPNGDKVMINVKGDPVAEKANNVEYILTFRIVEDMKS